MTATPLNLLNTSYDDCSDVLYISIGLPCPSFVRPVGHLLLRYSYVTHELTGITVLDTSGCGTTEELIKKLSSLIPFISIDDIQASVTDSFAIS